MLIVGSRDEVDWLHPLEVARSTTAACPNAELLVEDEGESPLAWQGARLSERDRRLPGAERLPASLDPS